MCTQASVRAFVFLTPVDPHWSISCCFLSAGSLKWLACDCDVLLTICDALDVRGPVISFFLCWTPQNPSHIWR